MNRHIFFIIRLLGLNLIMFFGFDTLAMNGTTKSSIPGNLDASVYPELVKFIEFHRCSKEFETNKKQHFLKGDQIDRLINVKRLGRVIEQKQLTRLQVPHKCVSKKSDGNFEVLSERLKYKSLVERYKSNTISLSDVQQLVTLAEETAYTDWHGGNIGHTVDNKIAICDTEDRSFVIIGDEIGKLELLSFLKQRLLAGYSQQSKVDRVFKIEPEALAWLEQKLSVVRANEQKVLSLKANTSYDDKAVDYEKVKKELKLYRQKQAWW